MNTNTMNTCNTANWQCATGTKMPFENISAPGCYVCNWNGHLLRVPADAVTPGRSPVVNMVGSQPLWVTMISNNPYIALSNAKTLAANFDLPVNF